MRRAAKAKPGWSVECRIFGAASDWAFAAGLKITAASSSELAKFSLKGNGSRR
jgi:hypothetical protein